MKKTIAITLVAVMLLTTICITSMAARGKDNIMPMASNHIRSCSVSVTSGGGKIDIDMTVFGKGVQDKLGVSSVEISEKVGDSWSIKKAFSSDDNQDEFFDYNTSTYTGSTYYYGTAGKQYKITIYAVGQKGNSSDYMTKSTTIICK